MLKVLNGGRGRKEREGRRWETNLDLVRTHQREWNVVMARQIQIRCMRKDTILVGMPNLLAGAVRCLAVLTILMLKFILLI